MTVNAYRLGSMVTLTGRFFSDAAKTTPADPDTVVLSIRDPAGTITTPTATSSATGIWTYSWTPTLRGMHDVRWVGTGAVVSADQEAVFILEDFALGLDLTTVANVKAAITLNASTSDGLIQDLITQASAAITARYQREFAAVSGTPTRRVKVTECLVRLAPYDLRSASSVVLNPESSSPATLTAGTDYTLEPVAHTSLGTYTELRLSRTLSIDSTTRTNFGYALLDITGTWGAAAIPADVARACIITVAAWLDRGADVIAGMDSTVRPDGTTMSPSWAIPFAAHSLLQKYAPVIVA